jgi:hypothetical protein
MKRRSLRLLLALSLLTPGLAAAQQPLDPVRFEGVLAAARSYAVDVSLVNYCLRVYDEQRPFLYYAVQLDLEKALDTLKAVDADAPALSAAAPRQARALSGSQPNARAAAP